MSADTKLRSYIDRILRSRSREDAEKANTKEIYKELAGDGYDKTIVGKVVNHLRKDENKAREQSEKFDLYLMAYLGASHTHAYAREDDQEVDAEQDQYDAETGEVTEHSSRAKAAHAVSREEDAGERQHSSNSGKAGADEPGRQTSASADADPALIHEPEAAMLPQTVPLVGAHNVSAGQASVESPASSSRAAEVRTASVGVGTSSAGMEGEADRHPIPDISKPNPICRDPDDCGVYASWHLTCEKCKAAAALRSAA